MKYKNHLIIKIEPYNGDSSSLETCFWAEGLSEEMEEGAGVYDEDDYEHGQPMYCIANLDGEIDDYGYDSLESAQKAVDASVRAVARRKRDWAKQGWVRYPHDLDEAGRFNEDMGTIVKLIGDTCYETQSCGSEVWIRRVE